MDAYNHFVALDTIYFVGSIIILLLGLGAVVLELRLLIRSYDALHTIIKPYVVSLICDIVMIGNFLPRDLYNLTRGGLQMGPWCEVSGFVAIVTLTTLNCSSLGIGYMADRAVLEDFPSDHVLLYWVCMSWAIGVVLACPFISLGIVGPYKGLYCCAKHDEYEPAAVVSILAVTFGSVLAVYWLLLKATKSVKDAELRIRDVASDSRNKGRCAHETPEAVLKRAVALVSIFYGCWLLTVVLGLATAVGAQVHPGADVAAAWLVKCMPLLDGLYLVHAFTRILRCTDGGDDEERYLCIGGNGVCMRGTTHSRGCSITGNGDSIKEGDGDGWEGRGVPPPPPPELLSANSATAASAMLNRMIAQMENMNRDSSDRA